MIVYDLSESVPANGTANPSLPLPFGLLRALFFWGEVGSAGQLYVDAALDHRDGAVQHLFLPASKNPNRPSYMLCPEGFAPDLNLNIPIQAGWYLNVGWSNEDATNPHIGHLWAMIE